MEKDTMVILILSVLIVISLFQTYHLTSVKNSFPTGAVSLEPSFPQRGYSSPYSLPARRIPVRGCWLF